jgi:formylglycine-generating enzyme required for sulfatase activity
MISAFFGLDDELNGQAAWFALSPQANPWNVDNPFRPNPGQLTPQQLNGLDGLPVVFSELLDPTTVDPSDFLITTASGATYTPVGATVNPAHDEGERRTVALFGQFGDADSDPPVTVSLVGELLTVGGVNITQSASPIGVIPLADGPTLVYAETVDPTTVDEVDGSALVLRAVWAGGIVATDGNEVTEHEWSQYVLSGADAFGNPVELTPIGIRDLNDNDNNHLLYFDQAITPDALFLPGGLVIDPNGDANPATSIAVVGAPGTVAVEWSTVDDAGNAPDPTTGFGSVGYGYRIGTYEVTNAQYAAFLNSVAASDPNGLYNTNMGSSARGGITRSGTDGSFTYSVRENMGNKPVNFVSWYDAARMSNWMTNGQGSGGTESGVYTLTGPTSISAITRDLSNPNQVFIPTEGEWYKAAFHQPASEGGDGDDYWLYATQSNSVPTIAGATSIGDVANPGTDVVNYETGADWNGRNGNVTTVGSAGNTSFYSAFDMNGNVWEWNETLIIGSFRGIRGGSFSSFDINLPSSFRNSLDPAFEDDSVGFRLASPVLACSGDANGDGVVNFTDLNAVLTSFGQSVPPGTGGDVNDDGVVNFTDLNEVLANFGVECP